MNPLNGKQLERLRDAAGWSRRKLQIFRENQYALVQQTVGSHYSDNGAPDRVPINFLELALSVWLSYTAAQAPSVLVSTRHQELKPKAAEREVALRHLFKEIAFGTTLERWARSAFFSVGIMKVALEQLGDVEIDGVLHDTGQPYADAVDLDNFVVDMGAKVYEKAQYVGDTYRVPFEWAVDNERFDKKARAALKVSEWSGRHTPEGDSKLETISTGEEGGRDEYRQHVEIQYLWLPMEGLVVHLPAEGDTERPEKPLLVEDWTGPERGMYHLLGYGHVPGNLMPLAPLALLEDLHLLANSLFRKCGRQADRQKTILGVSGGAAEDGSRVVKASDGDAIRMDHPDQAKDFRFGGVDPQTLAFLLNVKDQFAYFGGNIDTLGGLSPQADTLGQEKMLDTNASKRMAGMQKATVLATQRVIEDLAFYLSNDPLIQLPLVKRVKGTDLEVPFTYTNDGEDDFSQYNFKIEPYSMQYWSPGERLQTITQFWTTFVAPNTQMLQQAGIMPNWPKLLQTVAHLTNMDELEDILIFAGGVPDDRPGPVHNRPTQAPVTNRINTRINRPGATRIGKDAALMQSLMGAPPQPKQMAGVLRPTG